MKKFLILFSLILVILVTIFTIKYSKAKNIKPSQINITEEKKEKNKINDISKKSDETNNKQNSSSNNLTARVVANGDLLYHDLVYMSAIKDDGSYDFTENFKYVKNFISSADLAIADFEGTINPNKNLGGYPSFNAPQSLAKYIKDAGYDAITLANNHILDSSVEGLKSTSKILTDAGLDIFGVYPNTPREKSKPLIKNVNGIKIALLAYCYGFNGMEATLSKEEFNSYMSDLNEVKIQKEIELAKKEADVVIVFPHMGVEYALNPSEDQVNLYKKMLNWGADVILGGHPHVIQPTEVVNVNGKNKFILYSMGNFISNQRLETLENIWTERGVIADITFEKSNNDTNIKSVKLHPTWVSKTPQNRTAKNGYKLQNFSTLICEDVISNRSKYPFVDDNAFSRIEKAYKESMKLFNFDESKFK